MYTLKIRDLHFSHSLTCNLKTSMEVLYLRLTFVPINSRQKTIPLFQTSVKLINSCTVQHWLGCTIIFWETKSYASSNKK